MKEAVILANGEFPKGELSLRILNNSNFLICCDGAINKLLKTDIEPNLIIGDLDSINEDLKTKFADILIKIADQNTNDLTKAINWCVVNNITDVTILGATGKREDHTIANISLLSKYIEQLNVKIITDFGIFTPITKTTMFKSEKGQQVSIFSLDCDKEISSENLKYPLHNLKLETWWMGTLNESTADNFTIICNSNARVIVYQTLV